MYISTYVQGMTGAGQKRCFESSAYLTAASAHGCVCRPGMTATLRAMKTRSLERIADVPPAWPAPGRVAAQVANDSDDRHARGLRALAEITGDSGETVVESLRDVAPDLAAWIIDFSYGDVMSRPGLDRRSRQLATVAALTALGNAQPQLEVHIAGALNVGCKPQEIIEVILQMAVFAGFPAAINALNVAREVFRTRGELRPPA
jgi:4-carboxymuconolactone decarboxylase